MGRLESWEEGRGLLGVRCLSLADKDVGTTNSGAAGMMREGDRNVFPGWHSGPGVHHLSTRTLRNSQLLGPATLEVGDAQRRRPAPLLAFLLQQRLLLRLLLRLFLSDFFFPLAPPRYFWPTVLSLRPDPPASTPAQSCEPLCLPGKLIRSVRLLSPPPPSARWAPGLPESPGKRRQKRRLQESPGCRRQERRSQAAVRNRHPRGSRLSRGRPCQLRSSSSTPGRPLLAGLGSELRGVGCYLVISPPKAWGRKEWGRNTTTQRRFRNPGIRCGVSVPQTAATCVPQGEPQRAGPGRQMRGREKETERASEREEGGRRNTETVGEQTS